MAQFPMASENIHDSTQWSEEGKGYHSSESENSLWKDCLKELKSLVKELSWILAAPQGGSKSNDSYLLLFQPIAEPPSE